MRHPVNFENGINPCFMNVNGRTAVITDLSELIECEKEIEDVKKIVVSPNHSRNCTCHL